MEVSWSETWRAWRMFHDLNVILLQGSLDSSCAMRRRAILLQDEPSAAFPDLCESEQQLILDDAFISSPVNVECFERESMLV